jgi:hypothetical protein
MPDSDAFDDRLRAERWHATRSILAADAGAAIATAILWLAAAVSSPNLLVPNVSPAVLVLEIVLVYFVPLAAAALCLWYRPGTRSFVVSAVMPVIPFVPLLGAAAAWGLPVALLALVAMGLLLAAIVLSIRAIVDALG